MRHRRAHRDVASLSRLGASSASSESAHAYFANASSIADDISGSRRARRGARASEVILIHDAVACMDILYTKVWSFRFFLFFVRVTRSFLFVIVIRRRARDSIRIRSIRFGSTCARSFSRVPRARARGRASRRDDEARRHHHHRHRHHHRWHPRRPGARERDEVDARGRARWRRMGFHPMRTCVRKRTRARDARDDRG